MILDVIDHTIDFKQFEKEVISIVKEDSENKSMIVFSDNEIKRFDNTIVSKGNSSFNI